MSLIAIPLIATEPAQALDTVVPSLMPGLALFRYNTSPAEIRKQCKCECTDVEGESVNAEFAGDGITAISTSAYAVAPGETCPVDFVFRGEELIGVCVYRDTITFKDFKALNDKFMDAYGADFKNHDVLSEMADLQAFMRGDPHSAIRYGSENCALTVSVRWEEGLKRSTATFVFRSPSKAAQSNAHWTKEKLRDALVRTRAGFIRQ